MIYWSTYLAVKTHRLRRRLHLHNLLLLSFLDPRHEKVGVEFDSKGPYAISVNDEIAIVTGASKLNRKDGKVKGSPFQKLTIGKFELG